jgi:hypothetical protein
MTRSCACPHGFPLCACAEGLHGTALLDRSRRLSSLAGWPARVDPADAARVLAAFGRQRPVWLALPRVTPDADGEDCGCGQGRA